MKCQDFKAEKNYLRNHLEKCFSKGRSHMQPVQKRETENYVKNFFNGLKTKDTLLEEQRFQYNARDTNDGNTKVVCIGNQ